MITMFTGLCPWMVFGNEHFEFRYDIFTRAAFAVLKNGGNPVTAKKCKFRVSIPAN